MRRFIILALAAFMALPPGARADGPNFNPAPLQAQAQSGDANAQFQLGTLDYVGLGVVQDYVGAFNLLKQAAQGGNAQAACEAGFLYQTGSYAQGPPPPDPKDAVAWYEMAAKAGDACGEFALGELYAAGQGVTADPVKAATLLAQAAAQGLKPDPASFPLEQLQQRFYAVAYKITGTTDWVDQVSISSGGGE